MSEVGKAIALIRALGTPTDAQVTSAVEGWLDDHPEATTTVTDGSITNAKLASSFVTPGTAAAYSSSATYAVGDYVFHNGALYRCITAITTAEAWTAAHWTAVALGDDVADLKREMDIETGETNLDSVAFGDKTYRDIFITNNKLPDGDFENGLDWISTNTGGAVISDYECESKAHSLKCFGSSSVQIRKDLTYNAGKIYVACKAHVLRRSAGNVGFTASAQTLHEAITSPTIGFVTVSTIGDVSAATSPQSVFFGTYSAADADAYIDDCVFVHLTDCFGQDVPTKTEMDALYDNWIAIKNNAYESRLVNSLKSRIDYLSNKPVFVGAVLGATSSANRFAAMRQLYAVAQKVIDDPTYQTSDSDLTYSAEGAVCVLPAHNAAMYQKYAFDVLYSKAGTTKAVPASTTKVMTLVTGLDFISDIYERVTIAADDIEDGSSSILQAGDIVTINDLIYAMLLPSSNTAAIAFARVAGEKILTSQNGEGTYTNSECKTAFVSQMAVKAANLGMTNSTFVSPSGRSESNLTTVLDMLKFTIDACAYPEILRVWNKKSYDINVKGTNERTVSITTSVTDNTLETYYYIFGGKTGTLSLNGPSAIALVLVAQPL